MNRNLLRNTLNSLVASNRLIWMSFSVAALALQGLAISPANASPLQVIAVTSDTFPAGEVDHIAIDFDETGSVTQLVYQAPNGDKIFPLGELDNPSNPAILMSAKKYMITFKVIGLNIDPRISFNPKTGGVLDMSYWTDVTKSPNHLYIGAEINGEKVTLYQLASDEMPIASGVPFTSLYMTKGPRGVASVAVH